MLNILFCSIEILIAFEQFGGFIFYSYSLYSIALMPEVLRKLHQCQKKRLSSFNFGGTISLKINIVVVNGY